jgi:hypothetical protein
MTKRSSIPVHTPKTKAEFNRLSNTLTKRGFVALDALKPGGVLDFALGDKDSSQADAKSMAASIGDGALSSGPLAAVAYSFDSYDTVPSSVSGADGEKVGRGYVKFGPSDNLPTVIYALAKALPYTASPLRYLADLSTGLGPRLMYRFPDGTTCEYRDAGYSLLQELEQAEEEDRGAQLTAGGFTSMDHEPAGSPRVKRAREAYEKWQRSYEGYDETDDKGNTDHVPGIKEFLEDNDLSLHCSQCMQDDVLFDLYFPTVGFERGRRGIWNPKIVRVGILPIATGGVRYEVMNDYRYIEHVYFSDRWRTNGRTGVQGANVASSKVVMYPTAMPQGRLSELRYIVKSNARSRIKDRPTWVACPVYYGNKPYYQQPAWWSIFLSKFYDFASTIAYDKAKQRENRTSWGKIFYISLDYLDQVFSDEGYDGQPEKQQEFINDLEKSMEDFLQHRENHGKMMRQWMWEGKDGKEHHNVEIVDITETTKDAAQAGKDELELATSPIFLALGVDPRLVGVPMVHSSNGGTALREMHLLKQQQMNVKQRGYLAFLQAICSFNGWDRAEFQIVQQTLTTLDNSKTGTVETIAGEQA